MLRMNEWDDAVYGSLIKSAH